MNIKITPKVLNRATIGIVIYLLCFGVAMTYFPIRPFWNDEWRLIYNLKFKNVSQLWGTLDLLQQCPRFYLTALKAFTSWFDYSYTSLRLPSLITGMASIPFCFYLRKRIFPDSPLFSYLFILILVSSQTFTDYLVQVKHYNMEIFLCLLALWQFVTLLEHEPGKVNHVRYGLLCFSFLVAPFFSYTYPIVIAPVIAIVIQKAIISYKNKQHGIGQLVVQLLPMVIVAGSIVIFYFIDVRQLLSDNRMYQSYLKMLGNEKGESHFIADFWNLFALLGSGFVYEIIFGITGIAAFIYGVYRLAASRNRTFTRQDYFKLYALLLVVLTIAFIFSGKLLGGVARLTAFTIPSISILIISFFEDMRERYHYIKPANSFAAVLFIGLFGNIFTTCIHTFTKEDYNNRITTYWNTSEALKQARLHKIPILFTDGVKGYKINQDAPVPGKISYNTITPEQIRGNDDLCSEVVLKVNPEYKTWDSIKVYQMPDTKWTNEYINQLPTSVTKVLVGDGTSFRLVSR